MKLLGLKLSRWRQWAQAVRAAGPSAWPRVASAAFWLVAEGLVSPRNYRARLTACNRCPIYDKASRRCADTVGLGQGCGCYMPVKALGRGARCWMESATGRSEWDK